jgi:hypothetical protein
MVAWSNFQADWDDERRMFTKRIKPGDEVSQSDLDIEDEEWDNLVAEGAVREQPYPKALIEGSYTDSPNKYYIDQLQKAAEGLLSGDEMKELQSSGQLPEEEAAETTPAPKTTSSTAKS